MSSTAPLVRYSATARWLHWLIAIGIIAAFTLGLSADAMSFSPAKLRYINWHKWLGVTIFALACLRVLWRVVRKPPEPLPAPHWQLTAAHVVHTALYLLIFAVPLSGYCFSLAAGYPVVWLGLVPLPVFFGADEALADRLFDIHQWLAWTMCIVVVLHALAALKHHFIDRDDVLRRMLPGR